MDFPFHFGQKSSLLLIFFFHGIVFTLILLKKGINDENTSNRWLSLLLFLCSLYIVPYMLGYAGWYEKNVTAEILFFIPFMQVLIIGPVVFFYIRSLLEPNIKFKKKDWVHFIPGILYLIYSLIVFITDKLVLDEFYFYADRRDKDLKTWYQLVGFLSIGVYLIFSLQKYRLYKKAIFNVVSYADSVLFKWIQNFLLAFLMLLILRIMFFVFNEQWSQFGSHFWYFICFSFVLFYVAINGYTHAIKSNSFLITNFPEDIVIEEQEKQKISDSELNKWKSQILSLLENDKIYQNPQLTLADVANKLNTTSKNISTSINQGFDKNFNDLVNYYRIEAIKEKIQNKEHLNSTLLGIALDCGFNSKATFNRAFKKITLLTPKAYIDSLK